MYTTVVRVCKLCNKRSFTQDDGFSRVKRDARFSSLSREATSTFSLELLLLSSYSESRAVLCELLAGGFCMPVAAAGVVPRVALLLNRLLVPGLQEN